MIRSCRTSKVVIASTMVDFPDPISPVNRALWPEGTMFQMHLSNVPQFLSSNLCRRNPDKAFPEKFSPFSSIFFRCFFRVVFSLPVLFEFGLNFFQLFDIQIGVQNAAHLILLLF